MGAADTDAHLAHSLVRRGDRYVGGPMDVGDGRQVQVEGGGAVAVGHIGQVEGDGARVGGQGAGLVLLAPGLEHREGGLVDAPRALGATRLAVRAGLLAEARLQSGGGRGKGGPARSGDESTAAGRR